jgi:hypothetical protein
VLQHYLEDEIERRSIPDPITPSDFLDLLTASGISLPSDRAFLNRIAQVACERYNARRIDRDAPALIIVPAPLTEQQAGQLLGDRLNYVMVFGAEVIYFQDTVHAVAVDGYSSGGVNVLGAHTDWVSSDGGSIKRCLAVDATGLVKEIAFEKPVPIHIVQILHLPLRNERQLHRDLSARFRKRGIPQINPYESSERADNKAWTHALWKQCGREIASPEYILIPQGSPTEEIVDHLRSFTNNIRKPGVVVQPNKGTEGRGVEKFSPKADSGLLPIVEYISMRVLAEDDAIVRELRGNVRYGKIPLNPPLQKGDLTAATLQKGDRAFLNVAFRVNVAWNGSEFVAESGYAQVAKDGETFPASRGRGGKIVDINDALANLYYPKDGRWIRFIPADEDIVSMKNAAVNAAYGLNAGLDEEDYLKLMGVDILLEVEEYGNAIPVVLEANPRPAGLSHSSEITGISGKRRRSRISVEMFNFIGSTELIDQ